MSSDNRLEKINRIHQLGQTRYIWRVGVLLFGSLAAALTWLLLQMINYLQTGILLAENWQSTLLLCLVLFPIAGFFWGHWMWRISESRYDSAKSGHKET